MKKRINISAFTCIVLLFVHFLASCTLDMTDWVTSEEEKGYGELLEEKTPYYDVKYQYKDNTRSLTDNIREYLVNVEADTILYFMDNMPSEWIPENGGQVVCNCCMDFPMGLIGKVLSVERGGGMIKVTTTPCDIEDAYEDFQLDLDMDVVSTNSEDMQQTTTTTNPATRAGGAGGTIVHTYDWTMFNLTSDDEKVICRDGALTRSTTEEEAEDYFNKDLNEETSSTNEIKIISFDQDSYPLKPLFTDKVKKWIQKAEIGLYYLSKTNIKKKIRLKDEYEYTKQIETTGLKLDIKVGRGKTLKECPKTDKLKQAELQDEVMKLIAEANEAGFNIKDPLPAEKKQDPELQFMYECPLGTLPFGFVIRIRPVFDFSVSLMGNGEIIFWTGKTQTEVTISHGKKTETKPKKLATPANEFNPSVVGSFNISGGIDAFGGFGKMIGKGVRARAYALGVWGTVTLDFEGNIQYAFPFEDCLNGDLDCGISLAAHFQFGLKGLGGRWGEYNFIESEKYTIWDGFDLKFFPKVKVNDLIQVIIDQDKNGKYKEFKVKYSYPHLGIYATNMNTSFKPRLRVYKGNNTDDALGEYVDLDPDTKVSFVNLNKTYTFTYKTYDFNQDFTVVPVLYRNSFSTSHNTLFYDNKRYIDKEARPMVKFFTNKISGTSLKQIVYQTYGDHPSVDMGTVTGLFNSLSGALGYYQYSFSLPFYMYNASVMRDYWSDFGIYYEIKVGSKIKSKYRSLIGNIKKSGYYSPNISFLTTVVGQSNKVNTSAYLYYVLKDDPDQKKRFFYGPDAWIYTKEHYINHTQGHFPEQVVVHDFIELLYPFKHDPWPWQTEFENHNVNNINIEATL